MKMIIVLWIILTSLLNCYSQTEQDSNDKIALAAKNIFEQLQLKPGNILVLVNSANQKKLVPFIKTEAQKRNISVKQFNPYVSQDSLNILSSLLQDHSLFFVFLIDPSDAQFLFQYAGRPDLGLKMPEEKLFSNWLVSEDQLIRLNSIDMDENRKYQKKLKSYLNTTDTIFISTELGTRIRFIARNWVADKGEIYCTPIEYETNGVIMVDGCAYWGAPQKPIRLNVLKGKVVNIDSLADSDKQEKWIKNDLTADENASMLAEVGIGTNKNALWNSDLMESEQARGTCHFGFGMNLNYGGQIKSKKHFDLVVLKPTIIINKTLIYKDGVMVE